MADATVTRATRDDALTLANDATVEPPMRVGTFAAPRALAIIWGGFAVALLGFLAFGTVRIGAGNWIGSRLPVREIWARFTGYLVDEGAGTMLVAAVTAAAVLAIAGAGLALWVAFGLEDAAPGPPPDDAGGQ